MHRHHNLTSKIKDIASINMTKLTKVFSTFMLVFLIFANPAFAMTQQEAQNELNQINADIGNINASLNTLRSQKNTLANELAILDAQTQAIQLQINAAQSQITVLDAQIVDTNAQIAKAEADIQAKKVLLQEYLKTMYMNGRVSQLELVLTSDNFSDFVDQSEYLNTITQNIQDTTNQIVDLRTQLEQNKKDLQIKMDQAVQLKISQTSARTALDIQASEKNNLLLATKGDESAYQASLNGKVSRKGILECIAAGGCRGDANGKILVVNQPLHYYQWQAPWGNTEYDPGSTFANVGCLITSLAMYHGITPPQEAARHRFSNGYMQGTTGSSISTNMNTIESYLIRGQDVILKLNMGAYGHFVLAVGVDTDTGQILINDPYNGSGTKYDFSRVLYAEIPY